MERKSGHEIALAVIASVILTIILVSLVNVGLSIFLEEPDYEDYCERIESKFIPENPELIGGTCVTVSPDSRQECCENKGYERYDEESGRCMGVSAEAKQCEEDWESARENYNQYRYYVFAGIGFLLLLLGVFATMHSLQYTGLATGAILLTEGIVTNFENKILVFVSLLLILAVFGFLVWKKIEKRK